MNKIQRDAVNNMLVVFITFLKDAKISLEEKGYIPTVDLIIEKLEEMQTNTNPVD